MLDLLAIIAVGVSRLDFCFARLLGLLSLFGPRFSNLGPLFLFSLARLVRDCHVDEAV